MRTPPLLPGFVFALAITAGVARAESSPRVEVHVVQSGDELVVAASAWLAADTPTAWSVLTDYAGYRAFIPGVRASRVVARRGTTVLVEQSDELILWVLRMPVRVTYEIDEFPPARLTSRAIAPSFPSLDGTFVLDRSGAGTRLDYVGRISAGTPMLGRLEQRALEQAALRGFNALASEIERRSAAATVN
jgi:hypothetical protein